MRALWGVYVYMKCLGLVVVTSPDTSIECHFWFLSVMLDDSAYRYGICLGAVSESYHTLTICGRNEIRFHP